MTDEVEELLRMHKVKNALIMSLIDSLDESEKKCKSLEEEVADLQQVFRNWQGIATGNFTKEKL